MHRAFGLVMHSISHIWWVKWQRLSDFRAKTAGRTYKPMNSRRIGQVAVRFGRHSPRYWHIGLPFRATCGFYRSSAGDEFLCVKISQDCAMHRCRQVSLRPDGVYVERNRLRRAEKSCNAAEIKREQ